MRIGLIGGSFDPIHKAHVQMAIHAKKQLQLDEVWFVVANDTPLKQHRLISFHERCEMVEIAIKYNRHFKVCTIEGQKAGKSYTINTIIELKKQYPQNEFYFVIGQDQVAQLHKWRAIDTLQKEVHLCAFERNKQAIDTPYEVQALNMSDYPISSTSVRQGNFIELHKGVRRYIIEHMLYMDFVKNAMSDYRYEHSISVANLCVKIAACNHMDINKAYLCGLLHDINKEFKMISVEDSERILKKMKPALLKQHKNIWHGYLGSFICAHKLAISDKDILLAIENHVLGECRNRYAMLLYVADKLDPLRDYDTSKTIALCKRNLYEGYKEVRKQQQKYYGEENVSGK